MKTVVKYIEEINLEKFSIFFTNYPDVAFVLEGENGEELAIATADNIAEIEDLEEATHIEIHNFGVREESRGYGSALISFLKERYTLEAHEVLPEARGFWEKMDVEIIEEG